MKGKLLGEGSFGKVITAGEYKGVCTVIKRFHAPEGHTTQTIIIREINANQKNRKILRDHDKIEELTTLMATNELETEGLLQRVRGKTIRKGLRYRSSDTWVTIQGHIKRFTVQDIKKFIDVAVEFNKLYRHDDIKPDNVMYDKASQKFMFFDFMQGAFTPLFFPCPCPRS